MIMEPKADRQKRSLELVASFVDGYADGWFFAVGECFKDTLDIKFVERVEPRLVDGQKQYQTVINEDGKARNKLATIKVMRWTQGRLYSFAAGHVLYDTPKGYLQWCDALKHITVVCSVISAIPNMLNEQGAFVNGQVFFNLSKPNQSRTGLETVDNYHATQNEFVKFLKDGTFKGKIVHQLLAIPSQVGHTQQQMNYQ